MIRPYPEFTVKNGMLAALHGMGKETDSEEAAPIDNAYSFKKTHSLDTPLQLAKICNPLVSILLYIRNAISYLHKLISHKTSLATQTVE